MHIYLVKMVCTMLLFGIQDGVSYAKMMLSFVFCFEISHEQFRFSETVILIVFISFESLIVLSMFISGSVFCWV